MQSFTAIRLLLAAVVLAGLFPTPTAAGFFSLFRDENDAPSSSASPQPDAPKRATIPRAARASPALTRQGKELQTRGRQDADNLLQTYETQVQGECWKEAVQQLKDSCESTVLSKKDRDRLALRFTFCQLQLDGKQPNGAASFDAFCPQSYDTRVCIANLPEKFYNVYININTHVTTLCFHIQEELFQEQSRAAVAALDDAGRRAYEKLRDVAEGHDGLAAKVAELHKSEEDLGAAIQERFDAVVQIHGALQRVLASQNQSLEQQARAAVEFKKRAAEHTDALGKVREDVTATLLDVMSKAQKQAVEDGAAVQRMLATIAEEATSLSVSAKEQQRALQLSSSNIVEDLNQIHRVQGRMAGYLLSIESITFYAIFLMIVFVVTTAERASSCRFGALVLGPVASFFVEKFYLASATQIILQANLWFDTAMSLLGSRGGGFSSSALGFGDDDAALSQLRYSFCLLSALWISFHAYYWKSPDQRQRENLQAVLKEAGVHSMVSAFALFQQQQQSMVSSTPQPRPASPVPTPPQIEDIGVNPRVSVSVSQPRATDEKNTQTRRKKKPATSTEE